MKLSREVFRDIKSFSKEQMENWLQSYYNTTYNSLRKQFNTAYEDELNNSIQNFIVAMGYTLHFNEDLHLQNDELCGFMEDLFVSVDLFRKGEYNPDDYREQLKEDGLIISQDYDYSKLYREKDAPYKEKYDKLIDFLNTTKSKAQVLDEIKELLGIDIDDKNKKEEGDINDKKRTGSK